MAKVVILGAGLTGLSAAYHLEENNFYDYEIFEKDDSVGGLCKSIKDNGFTYDFTGHLIHINKPYFKRFLEKITFLNNSTFDESFARLNRKSFVFLNDTFSKYPFQINLHGQPTDTIVECIEGYLKRKTSIKDPKNFYEWVLKHFGNGIGKHFLFPYNEKLLSFDIKQIHPSWTGRFVPKTNLRSILEGSINENSTKKIGYNSTFFYPKKGGIQFLPDQISKLLKKKVQTNYNAHKIDLATKTILFENGRQEKFETLISTLPLDLLLKKTNESSRTNLKNSSKKLICTSLINFNLGFDVPNLSNKHWIYFPEKKYPFYRIGFWHNFSRSLLPPNCSAIYGEFSYQPKTKTSQQIQVLTTKSIEQSLNILGVKKNNIISKKILHLNHAYVIYDMWRHKNLKLLQKQLQEEAIYSVGRFGGWKYSSMEEAILDGQEVAQKICSPHNFLHLTNKRVGGNEIFL